MSINRAISPHKQELSRNLNIFHLTAFGMNYILPFGITIVFGIIAKETGKTVGLPILLAFIIMLFTANSYIYMVKRNPVAGSLYSYVDSLLGRRIGFLAGWILFLDYILVPTSVSVGAIYYLSHYLPNINFHLLLLIYVLFSGAINLLGIRLLANVGLALLLVSEIVLASCLLLLSQHVLNIDHTLFSLDAFDFSSWHSLFMGTTLAVFGYLGYDAISTLAEEAKNPERDIPRAIIFSFVLSTISMFLLGYLGVLADPLIKLHVQSDTWVNNGFFFIVHNASGPVFSAIFTAGAIMSMLVFNIVSTSAGSRLLYSMGRDRVLSRNFFGKINKRFKTPHNNILLIMAIELIIGNLSSLEIIANLINFGAITAFFILNLAVFIHLRSQEISSSKLIRNIKLSVPLIGSIAMLIMIVLMQKTTLIVGAIWIALGIVYIFLNKYLRNYVNNDDISEVNLPAYTNVNSLQLLNASIDNPLIIQLQNCIDYEHWNTSKILINTVLKTDPDSLIIACNGNNFIGAIVAYNYDAGFSYCGLYYVLPEFRNEKIGCFLTGAALAQSKNRALACDALLMQVRIYEKIGFQPMFENRRYVFNTTIASTLLHSPIANEFQKNKMHIVPLNSCDFNDVATYDEQHFYTRREKFLQNFITQNDVLCFAYIEDNAQIRGIIVVSSAPDTYRVGPLFADNSTIAKLLVYRLSLELPDKICSIDMPLINKNIYELINQFEMVEGNMKLIRMHKGEILLKNPEQIYGHLSIELG